MNRRDALKTFGFVVIAAPAAFAKTADHVEPSQPWPRTEKVFWAGKCCGTVQWSALPPPGVSYLTHKFSLLDAIEYGSNMLDRDLTKDHETLVVGNVAKCIVMSLPHMVCASTKDGLYAAQDGLPILGTLINHTVVYDRTLPKTAFYLRIEVPQNQKDPNVIYTPRYVKGEIIDWPEPYPAGVSDSGPSNA